MILQGLNPRFFYRLKPYAGKWVKELSSVLWVNSSKAMLPTEVEHKSF
jgi:hypothetical protein